MKRFHQVCRIYIMVWCNFKIPWMHCRKKLGKMKCLHFSHQLVIFPFSFSNFSLKDVNSTYIYLQVGKFSCIFENWKKNYQWSRQILSTNLHTCQNKPNLKWKIHVFMQGKMFGFLVWRKSRNFSLHKHMNFSLLVGFILTCVQISRYKICLLHW